MVDSAAAPSEFAGCRLISRLGAGGPVQVHLALDLASGQHVVLKRATLGADPSSVTEFARFDREVEVLQRLRHSDIVRLLRAGRDAAVCWMVMEHVPGGDISRYTQPGALLPPRDVALLGARLARALHHVHSQGLLHRDIKPGNVLADWPRGVVKLGDFGLFRDLASASHTATGALLATPAYAAPEQLLGGALGPGVDLYGLGAVLFELLAGRPPFVTSSLGELLRAVAQQPSPDLLTLCPQIPAGLSTTVARALSKLPSGRPADALAMATELEAAAAGLAG